MANKSAEIVIATALPKERDAVLAHFDGAREIRSARRTAHHISTPSATLSVNHNVVVVCFNGMGNINSAIAMTQAINVWNPTHVVLAGIAGGRKDDRSRYLGDVLVGEQVVYYEQGKQSPGELARRYQVYRPGKPLLEAAAGLSAAEWALSIRAPRPDGTTGRVIPRAHFGVVASGEKVVKDPGLMAELTEDWAQLIGVEMEGAGACAALYEAGSTPGVLLAKSACDWADPEKADAWQEYAAATSAAFIASLLRRLPAIGTESAGPVLLRRTAYTGRQKLRVCGRLTEDWADLADFFEISPSARARFTRGREPHGVWEWLAAREKLDALSGALKEIGRDDLVEELSSES